MATLFHFTFFFQLSYCYVALQGGGRIAALICFLGIICLPSISLSQDYPLILNERGDTIPYVYPPPADSYVPNEIIIRFKPNALHLDMLCYNNWQNSKTNEKKDIPLGIIPEQRTYLFNQRFPVQALIADPALLNAILSVGGDTIKRITIANPCTDNISIARNGDIINCSDFLWMVLHLNNDTSAVAASFLLTYYYQSSVLLAEPNYYMKLDRTPLDGYFSYQLSLDPNMINAARAWDNQISNRGIKVGIIDNGLDYRHCDLGGNVGLNYKVVGGWNWTENNNQFFNLAEHGTPVAGIIGALTNRNCTVGNNSVAGIAGGWGPNPGSDEGIGCQLFGFRVAVANNNTYIQTSYAIAAIREASSYNPNTGYGYGIHILNNSYGGETYNESQRAAINYAFENGVSFVAARGNDYDARIKYPACYENSWVTSVGASNYNNAKVAFSDYGQQMDLLAPGNNVDIWTTAYNGGYGSFGGTSAATPHVSGTYALLRSTALEQGWTLDPEDYEGMIKASALDMHPLDNPTDPGDVNSYESRSDLYKYGYDDVSGWGHLKLGNIYDMISRGYRISHYSTNLFNHSDWSGNMKFQFVNDGRRNKALATGTYTGRRRDIYVLGIYHSSSKWLIDNNNPLYIWGRSGQGAQSGYSYANPNYQTGYTDVTSGSGGNNIVSGIIHYSPFVQVKTVQYDLYDLNGNYVGHVPPDNQLGLNYTIFGLETGTDVNDIDPASNDGLFATPNPAFDVIKFGFNVPEDNTTVSVAIYDLMGNNIYQSKSEQYDSGAHISSIDVSSFPQGIYICSFTIGTKAGKIKFSVIR